ncbi:aromatic-ring-hydroxylating dioxygenase subunit beta [Stenotrophomonas sp. MMGLT7]|uniref:aromatic-ring-hydroxylating dioxygenase subunit beta n=1 Tax=Stenotrophomonas sp. MMGLT7 TaxID=2901227 RepID=UPI001E5E7A3C|nr:aromatic-ring-hydroxylating dioxygenase subunit beta [Stenotrophomonas sp. MMGLT7]MCD7098782.1 aromatic-ring-hydroxylating dioxygenase subunit beta [Stenotrophomonas sp. MMGLT7]
MSAATMTASQARTISLAEAAEFIWTEADLLDHRDYPAWLALWSEGGYYVIPIDPDETDFENTLNIAYDDAQMRRMRTERLSGGFTISATPVARTARTVSRLRVLRSAPGMLELRAAQVLVEQRLQLQRIYAAEVEYRLLAHGDGLRLDRKVVRLLESTDALHALGYLP